MPKPLWAPWRLAYVEHADELDRCIFCEPEQELVVPRRACGRGDEQVPVLVRPRARRSAPAPGRLRAAVTPTRCWRCIRSPRARSKRSARSTAPHGFNLGWNLGRVAGAGIEDHVHLHVVPRWNGDTSFMPVLGDVKVLPEHLLESARRLRAAFAR